MHGNSASALLRVASYRPLCLAVLLMGIAEAMASSYLTLFAVQELRLRPLALGLFLTIRAVSAILFSAAFGHWLDRAATRLPLVLALAGAAVGYAALAFTTDFFALLVIAALPLGMSAAAFPQLFGLARGHLASANHETAERGIALLRASWSAAWAIGPALAAGLVEAYDFAGAFLASGACALSALAALALMRTHAPPRHEAPAKPAKGTLRQAVVCAAISLMLFHLAMFLGSVALPVVVTGELGGSRADVGLLFSLCAFLEVLVMAAFALRRSALADYRWLHAGFAFFILYFVLAYFAGTTAMMFAAQLPRAVAVALLSFLGISYIQSLLPTRAGAAAALFSNSAQLGSLLCAGGVGLLAEPFGYRPLFIVCALLCAVGLAFLIAARRLA